MTNITTKAGEMLIPPVMRIDRHSYLISEHRLPDGARTVAMHQHFPTFLNRIIYEIARAVWSCMAEGQSNSLFKPLGKDERVQEEYTRRE